MNPQPGEVWLVDLGLAAKTRPVVVVSRFDPDPPRALILYVPLTTQNRQSAYEVVLPKLEYFPFFPCLDVTLKSGDGTTCPAWKTPPPTFVSQPGVMSLFRLGRQIHSRILLKEIVGRKRHCVPTNIISRPVFG
jgi:hypothetical protein